MGTITRAASYLDSEWTLFSAASAAVLVAAALAALMFAVVLARRHLPRGAVIGLAGLFLVMSADELLEVHERLDVWFGKGALLAFIPLVGIAFGLWFATRKRLSGRAARLFELGATAWVASQAIELVSNPPIGTGLHLPELVIVEEFGELTGSALFALGLAAGAALLLHRRPRFGPLLGRPRQRPPRFARTRPRLRTL